jgi:hypothetical protein
MADERHSDHDEAKDTQTPQDQDEQQRPGFLGGRLAPVGARALALAGFVALTVGTADSRTSISFR